MYRIVCEGFTTRCGDGVLPDIVWELAETQKCKIISIEHEEGDVEGDGSRTNSKHKRADAGKYA